MLSKKTCLCISLFLVVWLVTIVPTYADVELVVDGNPSDWIALGLSPAGTDPAFNINETVDYECADLLEAWVHSTDETLYLMMKVRGGYPDHWDIYNYIVYVDVDQDVTTGDPRIVYGGIDFYLEAVNGSTSYCYYWSPVTLSWHGFPHAFPVDAGSLGHIEWSVPLGYIKFSGKINLFFVTYDPLFDYHVNSIYVLDAVIPEFPSFIILPLSLMIILLTTVFLKKRISASYQQEAG